MLVQGDIIDISGLKPLSKDLGLVVSHSCDLVNSKEPFAEIIPCHEIDELNGDFIRGKNIRAYDFCLSILPSEMKNLRVLAFEKVALEKSIIFACKTIAHHPDDSLLQTWLSARYKRQAIPDDLNAFFTKTLKLGSIAKKYCEKLIGFWFEYEEVASSDSPTKYDVDLYCVFDPSLINEKEKQECMQSIVGRSNDVSFTLNAVCYTASEITLDLILKMKRFYFDYISPEQTGE